MGFIPAPPPPKKQSYQTSDNVILSDEVDSIIDVAEISPSAYCNRIDYDNGDD
jgi:hypothetical protein